MCRWWALAILLWHASAEASPASPLARPEPSTFLASATSDTSEDEEDSSSPSTTVNGEHAEEQQIAKQVEEKIREHAEKKEHQEEESEEAESDSTFLIFVALGIAAIARFLCKGRVQREHSGYMVITDTSPAKKRETAAQFWMSKRTQSLDSTQSSDTHKTGSANGMPTSPPLRGGTGKHAESKGGLASALSSKK
eukprot:CAMPEP_0114663100 /NCGR_PEP_ID=MMETSP0191-20121206/26245_1 /TAXON_ID=126664 /ORGANISM="Sorites sp." /LENGTH=194 /DNA_ID=CAMNT_0001901455 /DNA_START=98 /DNA_END=682 /DNA_ORIENTATION=-